MTCWLFVHIMSMSPHALPVSLSEMLPEIFVRAKPPILVLNYTPDAPTSPQAAGSQLLYHSTHERDTASKHTVTPDAHPSLSSQAAGRPLYRNAFTRGSADGSPLFNPLDLSFKNVANTGVLYWAGRLWALWEVCGLAVFILNMYLGY